MQNENVRKLLMAAVGVYLVYTGITLIGDVMNSEPRYEGLFIAAGSVFVLLGVITAVLNLRSYIRFVKEMMSVDTEESLEAWEEENSGEELAGRNLDSIFLSIPESERKKSVKGISEVVELEPEVFAEEAEELELEVFAEEAEELEPEVIAEDAEELEPDDLERTGELKLNADDALDVEDEE